MTENKKLYQIADLVVEIPDANGLAERCRDYLFDGTAQPDVVIDAAKYDASFYPEGTDADQVAYMESARQFCTKILNFDGLYLHASAVEMNGKAYLFSGPCGTGKSTHTRLWQQTFGTAAQVFNDDKPILRFLDGQWYAFGTPWCGKDGINQNKKVPLGAICFLKQADHNRIEQLVPTRAIQKILSQTFHKFANVKKLDNMLVLLDALVRKVPVYELENKPEEAAARLSFQTMSKGAEEKSDET